MSLKKVLNMERKDILIPDKNGGCTGAKKCISGKNNCNECDDENTCLKCENDFYMVNDDNKNCISASNIQMDEY